MTPPISNRSSGLVCESQPVEEQVCRAPALEENICVADGYSVAEITREGWEKHMPGAPLNTLLPHDQWVKLGLPVGIHNLLDL